MSVSVSLREWEREQEEEEEEEEELPKPQSLPSSILHRQEHKQEEQQQQKQEPLRSIEEAKMAFLTWRYQEEIKFIQTLKWKEATLTEELEAMFREKLTKVTKSQRRYRSHFEQLQQQLKVCIYILSCPIYYYYPIAKAL